MATIVGITDALTAVTHPFIDDHATQIVTDSMPVTKLIRKYGEVLMHGGTQSQYPVVDTELGNAGMYDGGTSTSLSQGTSDILGAMLHGWGFFYGYVFYSHAQWVKNIGSHASDEATLNYATILVKAFLTDLAKLIETQVISGDGTGNNIQGLIKLFDTSNADYYGYDLTGADGPQSVTIATGDIDDLVSGDLIEAYTAVEDENRNIDHVLVPKAALQQIRIQLDADVTHRSDKGKQNIGHKDFSLFEGADYTLSLRMPTNRIWLMNFGNEVDTDNSDLSDKFFKLTFTDGEPGFAKTDWAPWPAFPATQYMFAWGAFNSICVNPKRQSQVKWT